ncbi:hypothetical protein J3R30DRAFT_3250459, partial [Lentinula aciculospora]
EIHRYKTQDAHSQELLDVRRKELQGARAFLNTFDMYSGADIVSMLKELNGETFQAAASITDMIVDSISTTGKVPLGYDRNDSWAVATVRRTLGTEIETLLQRDRTANEHITLVQIALQAGLNHISEYVLDLWTVPSKGLNKTIGKVFAGIQMQQSHVISRTWRSLTKEQTKRAAYQAPELSDYITDIVKALLVVAGWWPRTKSEREAQIESTVRGRISPIVSLLEKLDGAMSKITSMDLVFDIPPAGTSFDARIMEDTNNGESSSNGVVLLTSGIGLKNVDIDVRDERPE